MKNCEEVEVQLWIFGCIFHRHLFEQENHHWSRATEPWSSPWYSCLASYVATSCNLTPHIYELMKAMRGGLHLQHQNIKGSISLKRLLVNDGFSIIISMCFIIGCDLWFPRWSCSSSFCDSPTCAGIYGETHWWAGNGSLVEWESEGLFFLGVGPWKM